MDRKFPRVLVVVLAFLLASVQAFGDTIHLKSGGKFEGKLLSEEGGHVVFKIEGLGVQRFKKEDVLRVERGTTAFDELAKRRAKVGPEDAEGHYELGLWCKENGLKSEANRAFRAALEADPIHLPSRIELGPWSLAGIPSPIRPLVSALKPGNEKKREVAGRKLRELGEEAAPAAFALSACLVDRKAKLGTVLAAINALLKLGPAAVDALVYRLDTEKGEACRLTAQFMGPFGKQALKAIDSLLRIAKETENEDMYWAAASSAVQIDPGDPRVLAFLRSMLRSKQDKRVNQAIQLLGKTRTHGRAALEDLEKIVEGAHAVQGPLCIAAIGRIRGQPVQAVEDLVSFLVEHGKPARGKELDLCEVIVCSQLFSLAQDDLGEAIEALFRLASGKTLQRECNTAGSNLIELGPKALPVLLRIAGSKTDEDADQARIYVWLLKGEIAPHLVEYLADPDTGRGAALSLMLYYREKCRALVLAALDSETPRVRNWCLEIVGLKGKGDPVALLKVRAALEDPDPGVRKHAQKALDRLNEE